MPFDNTNTQDRAELVATVSNIVRVFDNAAIAADAAADDKAAACDAILSAFRSALKDYDLPPFYFWIDICAANRFAHTRLDPATGKTTKVEGEKPHNTLKNVASQIKKYFENNGNLEIDSYTELRKANAPAPASDFEKAVKALAKLSSEELASIRSALDKVA
jgi:hypothetical protein